MKKAPRQAFITRRLTFSAAHRLHSDKLSPEENRRVFGKCNHPNGHGHNYVLEVTVAGQVDAITGFVIDLKVLKEILQQAVLDHFDHRHLNKEVLEFATAIPTTENIAIAIWRRLEGKLAPARLYRVRLYEQPDLFVDCFGEGSEITNGDAR